MSNSNKWSKRQMNSYNADNIATPNKSNIRMMHINKTAGTSVINWILAWSGIKLTTLIGDKSESHHTTNSSHIIKKDFSKRDFYFTIVRNPYNRLASHYFQWQKYKWWKKQIRDLDDFVSKAYKLPIEELTEKVNRHQPEFILPCTAWITDFSKFKIFKTENLDEMYEFFTKHCGSLDHKIGRDSTTKTKGLESYKDLYNEESLKIIQRVFHDDFENFGYEK